MIDRPQWNRPWAARLLGSHSPWFISYLCPVQVILGGPVAHLTQQLMRERAILKSLCNLSVTLAGGYISLERCWHFFPKPVSFRLTKAIFLEIMKARKSSGTTAQAQFLSRDRQRLFCSTSIFFLREKSCVSTSKSTSDIQSSGFWTAFIIPQIQNKGVTCLDCLSVFAEIFFETFLYKP